MEGNLLKWTNYWNGWQLRYFVLKDGILSYFNNKAEISNGAKRSYKIFMFDIIVSKNDNTRVDLIVANDQHLYLKACDYKERQKWLVALASQKATQSSKTVPTTLSSSAPNNADMLTSHLNLDETTEAFIASNALQQTPFDKANMLKLKQSELRLYCDLLSQQTHELKGLVNKAKTTDQNDSNNNDNSTDTGENTLAKTQVSDKIDFASNKAHGDDSTPVTKAQDSTSAASSFKSVSNLSINEETGDNESKQQATSTYDGSKLDLNKMDEITANINITCDMVIQIIRNVVVLSNTSSNVSTSALASLLEESNLNQSTSSTSSLRGPDFLGDSLSQYRYHLHHPLNNNKQLTKYRRSSYSEADNNSAINEKNRNLSTESDLILTSKSSRGLEDTRSLLSLPVNRSKNFNYLMQGARTTPIYAIPKNNDNNSSSPNGCDSVSNHQQNRQQRYNNLPILHNLKKYNQRTALNSKNFNPMTTMRLSNYSIKDSLKETSIIGITNSNDHLVKSGDSSVDDSKQSHEYQISTDLAMPKSKNNPKPTSETSVTVTQADGAYPSLTVEIVEFKSKTFFSQKKYCFKQIKLTPENEIPTEFFLGCCTDIFSLFDNFGSSAFVPVKVDIYGNITKLKQKYSSDTARYHTLQSIVQSEIDDNTTNVKNSATDALLWLKRAVWFLKEFLQEFSEKENPDLSDCICVSYQKSLRQYHNWVVRSLFSLALRSLPNTDAFLQGLAIDPECYLSDKEEFVRHIKEEMKLIACVINNLLNLINEMYTLHKLEK